MARDVVHECYEPHPQKTDLVEVFKASCSRIGEQRFPLQMSPQGFPKLLLDAQLLRFIHRNAVSNANKYGRRGGIISTHVDYDDAPDKQMLTIKVINEPGPGHETLLIDAEESSRSVFKAGRRLRNAIDTNSAIGVSSNSRFHPDHDSQNNSSINGSSNLSSGDGAWIMQKCAKNMGGVCSITFEPERTVFEFCCHAAPVLDRPSDTSKAQGFFLPLNTWALGIDDSWIQRKLLLRIFANAGIHATRKKVIGRSLEELDSTARVLTEFLHDDPSAKCLVLVDENLDYVTDEIGTSRVIRSGSKMMESILNALPVSQRNRILTLVRSANDSAQDVMVYRERTHGFFPKMATRRDDVMELLESAWKKRFGGDDQQPLEVARTAPTVLSSSSQQSSPTDSGTNNENNNNNNNNITHSSSSPTASGTNTDTNSNNITQNPNPRMNPTTTCTTRLEGSERDTSETDDSYCVSKDDLREAVSSVDSLMERRSTCHVPWSHIWSSLHSLKGDLMTSDQAELQWASAEISKLQGPSMPDNLHDQWSQLLRPAIFKGIDSF